MLTKVDTGMGYFTACLVYIGMKY